jgi:MFS family permease
LTNDIAAIAERPAQRHAPHLALVCLTLLFGCATLGMPLAVLPLFLHEQLGFSPLTVGWVVGLQSLATLVTRPLSGAMADKRGGRAAVSIGTLSSALAGAAYVVAALAADQPMVALAAVVVARLFLGIAESLLVTGGLTLSIATLGVAHTGKVMIWLGVAVYSALAFGAPFGAFLVERTNFLTLCVATCVLPLVGFVLSRAVGRVVLAVGARLPLSAVLRYVTVPGIALACCTIGFAAIYAFTALDYAAHGWSGGAYPIAAFGASFVGVRFIFGGLPDKVGARLALYTLPLMTIGQVLLWLAPVPAVAVLGAGMTGAGYSLSYPAIGIAAMRHVPPHNRGTAMGAFMVFFDLGLGLGGPLTGLIVSAAGLPAGYLLGAVASLLAYAIALRLTFRPES